MELTFIGTASGVPVPHRRHSAALLRHRDSAGHDTVLLIDCGEGTAAAMTAQELQPDALCTICITHTHADHVAGLPMLLQGLHLAKRTAPLDIFVPTGREDWFRSMLTGMYILPEKWSFPVRLHPLEDTQLSGGNLRMLPLPNRHLERVRPLAAQHHIPAGSFSLRFESKEERLLLSSDIAGVEDIAAHAARVDMLVIDSTHVPFEDITQLADSNAELDIVCTHIPPELEVGLPALAQETRERYGGRIRFAEDGMQTHIKRKHVWK
ncbi:MBL fold metallo-hydrolase [bacterium]|nr:MBL fold metallo-hydrolase [bacterium]